MGSYQLDALDLDQLRARSLAEVCQKLNLRLTNPWIEVDIAKQKVLLHQNQQIVKSYDVSTARKGPGQVSGSRKTPLGLHLISKKIGHDCPLYLIFVGRGRTERLCRPGEQEEGKDYVLSRIFVLRGLEEKINKGKDENGREVDSYKRLIYFHGTPYEDMIGKPSSQGCVRMKNADILVLFDLVPEGTHVWIH